MAKRSHHGAAAAAVGVLSLDDRIRFAITNKRLIELVYHSRRRIAEPHDYGALNHTAKLLVYQLGTSGEAGTKDVTGWRLLEVAEITACLVREEMFAGSRGRSYDQHLSWEVIYARVG